MLNLTSSTCLLIFFLPPPPIIPCDCTAKVNNLSGNAVTVEVGAYWGLGTRLCGPIGLQY